MSLIFLLLACAGITFTLVQTTIMDKIKLRPLWEKSPFLKELFDCAFCTGFHVGWIVGLFFFSWPIFLLFGFASASFSYIFEKSVILIDELTHKLNHK